MKRCGLLPRRKGSPTRLKATTIAVMALGMEAATDETADTGHSWGDCSTNQSRLPIIEWAFAVPDVQCEVGVTVGSGHSNAAAVTQGSAAGRHKSKLLGALVLTTTFMAVEVVGGLWTGSLALLADAAHMLTDAGGLVLALIAVRFAERPATPQKTYGYVRMEVLSALTNAVVLLLLTIYIFYEAYKRFMNPPDIGCGRDGGFPPPPAQIRTCRITAYGSCLGYLTRRSVPRGAGAYSGLGEDSSWPCD